MTAPQQKKDSLLALLREEKELLDNFLRLTEEQTASISDADTVALNASLRARQDIIERFDALRRESDALAEALGAPAQNAVSEREISALTDAIYDTARTAADKNAENAASSRRKLTELGGEINKLSLNRRSVVGYGRGVGIEQSEFFDKKM
ncbi:MAG: flagellar protein FlgN [Oscillospiraceae bacterium]|jgi:hypothetical protein|nr:flagellar protein FlgN [Oscillospiraceae bacterium]